MSAKSWNAKVIVDSAELRDCLQRNLEIWNAGCRDICLTLLAIRRGEAGQPGKEAWEYIAEKPQNYHLVYWLAEKPKPTGKSDDVQRKLGLAQAYATHNGGFDDRLRCAKLSLGPLWKQAIKASIERVKSYQAKLDAWQNDHTAWLNERSEWETAHADYMALRTSLEEFQQRAGATRGGRIRWHLWLDYLCTTVEIVRWRKPTAEFSPLDEDELRQVAKSGRRQQRKRAELIFAKNPELEAFNRLHGDYERRFARTSAKRRHPDGFRQRPTFTLPSLPKRPDWPRFQREENWQRLSLAENSVEVRLLNNASEATWVRCRFVPDPRIRRIRKIADPVKHGRTKYEYAATTKTGVRTLLQPQGVKLIKRPGGFFLSISFDLLPPPCRLEAEQAKVSKYRFTWSRKKLLESLNQEDVITCAVDLAIRHVGAISVSKAGEIVARRILHNRFSLPGSSSYINIPSLAEIADVQRQVRRARRASGKMSPTKLSCRRLQEHYRNLQNDRFKKAAAALCQYAAHYGADVLLVEDLKMLVPDTANERGVNRGIASWNRGNIVGFAEKIAEDYGLRVVKVPAYHTSRICAACSGVGVRFEQGKRRPFRKPRKDFGVSVSDRCAVQLAHLGHWFFCPACSRRVHADINASENLHRVFWETFPKAKRDGDYLVVNGDRILLSDVKAAAEEKLRATSFGPTPF